ncbi:50S ribosomal protein L15e [Vulcanisaeta souniana]|uniref:50S ribosomal protein L15e n=1 Tax=Vulcanisaeta souniana TaxID=164452 RepID=UPI0006D081FB|nr:50S ribosomal protein L15e [Vulcanisaeta souniana]
MAKGGLYHYLAEAWAGGAKDSWVWDVVMKQRLIEWRREPSIVRIEKPTRINKARQYGYKAKQGIIVVRVRLRRGGPFNRRRPNSGRRPKRMGVYGITTDKGLQLIAEERAARKYPNMEVLGSYWVGEDGAYAWYEVILVDPSHPAIRKDPSFTWLVGKEDDEGRRRRRLRERQRKLIERLRRKGADQSQSTQSR